MSNKIQCIIEFYSLPLIRIIQKYRVPVPRYFFSTVPVPRYFEKYRAHLWRKGAGRPQISEEIESVRVAYTRSPRKSIHGASTQLQIPRSTIHKVFIEIFDFMHIKRNYCKALKPEDKPRRKEHWSTNFSKLYASEMKTIIFD